MVAVNTDNIEFVRDAFSKDCENYAMWLRTDEDFHNEIKTMMCEKVYHESTSEKLELMELMLDHEIVKTDEKYTAYIHNDFSLLEHSSKLSNGNSDMFELLLNRTDISAWDDDAHYRMLYSVACGWPDPVKLECFLKHSSIDANMGSKDEYYSRGTIMHALLDFMTNPVPKMTSDELPNTIDIIQILKKYGFDYSSNDNELGKTPLMHWIELLNKYRSNYHENIIEVMRTMIQCGSDADELRMLNTGRMTPVFRMKLLKIIMDSKRGMEHEEN